MKLVELLNSNEALGRLRQERLPVRTALQLSKVIKWANEEIADFEKVRLELCERHGTKDETKPEYNIRPDEQAQFNTEFQELLGTEVEMSLKKIKADNLGNILVSEQDLALLAWLIDED